MEIQGSQQRQKKPGGIKERQEEAGGQGRQEEPGGAQGERVSQREPGEPVTGCLSLSCVI